MEREIQRAGFGVRAQLLHRRRLGGVVRNLFADFVQHARHVVRQPLFHP
jgi:hypothetical protein